MSLHQRYYTTSYPNEKSQFTTNFQFYNVDQVMPTFRIMDESGKIINKDLDPKVIEYSLLGPLLLQSTEVWMKLE